MSVYLDASVVVSTFVDDSHSDRVLEWLALQDRIVLSAWTVAEFSSALSHYVRTKRATASERATLEGEFDRWLASVRMVLPVTPEDFETARELLRAHVELRTPDALHLAIAKNRQLTLATLDNTLKRSAVAEGVAAGDL